MVKHAFNFNLSIKQIPKIQKKIKVKKNSIILPNFFIIIIIIFFFFDLFKRARRLRII